MTQLSSLLLAASCYGVGYAGLLPVMNTIVLESVSEAQRGQGTAVFSAALDVAYGGGAFCGNHRQSFGFDMMFLGVVCLLVGR